MKVPGPVSRTSELTYKCPLIARPSLPHVAQIHVDPAFLGNKLRFDRREGVGDSIALFDPDLLDVVSCEVSVGGNGVSEDP